MSIKYIDIIFICVFCWNTLTKSKHSFFFFKFSVHWHRVLYIKSRTDFVQRVQLQCFHMMINHTGLQLRYILFFVKKVFFRTQKSGSANYWQLPYVYKSSIMNNRSMQVRYCWHCADQIFIIKLYQLRESTPAQHKVHCGI